MTEEIAGVTPIARNATTTIKSEQQTIFFVIDVSFSLLTATSAPESFLVQRVREKRELESYLMSTPLLLQFEWCLLYKSFMISQDDSFQQGIMSRDASQYSFEPGWVAGRDATEIQFTAPTKARSETQGVQGLEVNAHEAKESEIDASESSTSASST